MIRIYDKEFVLIGILQNAIEVREERTINAINYLSFSLPYNDPKNELCQFAHYARLGGGDFYAIQPSQFEISEMGNVDYQCEHVFSLLLRAFFSVSESTASSEIRTRDVINFILSHQIVAHWRLGDCDFDEIRAYDFGDESLLSALNKVTEFLYDFIWEFDTSKYPFTLHLRKMDIEALPKFYLRSGVNVLKIARRNNSGDLCTRLYPKGSEEIGIESVNNGIPYLESPQSYLDKYGIIEQVWSDTRIKDPFELLSAGTFMLRKKQDIVEEYEVGFIHLGLDKLPELGDTFEIVGFKKAYVTGISFMHDEIQQSTIRVSDQPHNLPMLLASVIQQQQEEKVAQADINVDDVADAVAEKLGTITDQYYLTDFLETNFDALDATKAPPADNIRHFTRIRGDGGVEFVEAILLEDNRELVTEEPDDWGETNPGEEFTPETEFDRFNGLTDRNGKPVYWVSVDGSEKYTEMTRTDPVKRFPPTYPSGATQDKKKEIDALLRLKYAVKLRKTESETVTGYCKYVQGVEGLKDGLYLMRTLPPEVDGEGNPVPGETKHIGIGLTDAPIYLNVDTMEWERIGAGHVIVDADNEELPMRPALKFNNSIIEDDEEGKITIVTPLARLWKHLHIAENYFTVTWDNDEQDHYLLEFYEDGRVSAIIAFERRWTFSYE